jgi:hypothetical protein
MKLKCIILLSACLLINVKVVSQTTKISIKDGSIEPLVLSIDSISAEKGYKKTLEWLNYNYKSADAVKGSSIENKFVRFTGIKPNFATSFGYVYDLEYTIMVEFKDNRYRFVVEQLRSGVSGVFANFRLSDYYKSTGEPRKAYKSFTDGIEQTINDINASLYNYLTGVTKKENW